jgi:hypothetical protein
MTERYELRDEHGRTSGYVLREAPHRATFSHSGPRTSEPSPIAVAICLAVGAVMLVVTLAYLWVEATAG